MKSTLHQSDTAKDGAHVAQPTIKAASIGSISAGTLRNTTGPIVSWQDVAEMHKARAESQEAFADKYLAQRNALKTENQKLRASLESLRALYGECVDRRDSLHDALANFMEHLFWVTPTRGTAMFTAEGKAEFFEAARTALATGDAK